MTTNIQIHHLIREFSQSKECGPYFKDYVKCRGDKSIPFKKCYEEYFLEFESCVRKWKKNPFK